MVSTEQQLRSYGGAITPHSPARAALCFCHWREPNADKEPEELEWNVLPFGATCSPCCASFALQKHVKDNVKDPDVLCSVLEAFYVDNCLDGKPTVQNARQLVGDLCEALGVGGSRSSSGPVTRLQWLQTSLQRHSPTTLSVGSP